MLLFGGAWRKARLGLGGHKEAVIQMKCGDDLYQGGGGRDGVGRREIQSRDSLAAMDTLVRRSGLNTLLH